VPDLGFDWRPFASGSYEYTTADAAALVGCQMTYDSAVIDTNPIARGLAKFQDGAGGTKWCSTVSDTHSIPTFAAGATRTIRMLAKNYSAASGITVVNGGQWSWNLIVIPV
jgi:hypothetical protein